MDMHGESEPQGGLPSGSVAVAGADAGPGYEVRDTDVWAIIYFLVGLFIFLLFVMGSMWVMLESLAGPPETRPPIPGRQPSMGVVILDQRRRLSDYEDRTLNETTSPAKPGEPVHVPIGRAIDLLAERGLPPMPGPGVTEADLNSHNGIAVPDEALKQKATMGIGGGMGTGSNPVRNDDRGATPTTGVGTGNKP